MDLGERMDQLTAAFEREDLDAVRELLAPGARARRNNDEEHDVDMLLATIKGLAEAQVSVKYRDVRRVIGPDAVAEQHLVTLTRGDGRSASADVCLVVRFDDDGRAVRLDEYLDTSAFEALLE